MRKNVKTVLITVEIGLMKKIMVAGYYVIWVAIYLI